MPTAVAWVAPVASGAPYARVGDPVRAGQMGPGGPADLRPMVVLGSAQEAASGLSLVAMPGAAHDALRVSQPV